MRLPMLSFAAAVVWSSGSARAFLVRTAKPTSAARAFRTAVCLRCSEDDDLEGKTVVQLKDMLRGKKLKVGGRKDDLIRRLRGDEDAASSGTLQDPPLSLTDALSLALPRRSLYIGACKS